MTPDLGKRKWAVELYRGGKIPKVEELPFEKGTAVLGGKGRVVEDA